MNTKTKQILGLEVLFLGALMLAMPWTALAIFAGQIFIFFKK